MTRRSLAATCLFLFAIASRPAAAEPRTLRPLAIDDVIHVNSLGGPGVLSADGRWLAYVIHDPRRVRPIDPKKAAERSASSSYYPTGNTLWVADTETGETITVGGPSERDPSGTCWSPSWSPDGRLLAFFSDRDGAPRLWVWELATRKARRVSGALIDASFGSDRPIWTSDGRRLILKLVSERARTEAPARAATPPPTSPGVRVTVLRAGPGAAAASTDTTASTAGAAPIIESTRWPGLDLAVVDLASGTVRRVVRDVYVRGLRLSPDDAQLAYVTNPVVQRHTQQLFYDIVTVPIAGGAPRVLASRVPTVWGESISWSPDSASIAYVTVGQLTHGEAFVISATGGTPRQLTEGADLNDQADRRPLLWTPAGDAVLFVNDRDRQVWKAPVAGSSRVTAPLTSARTQGDATDRELRAMVPALRDNLAWTRDDGRSIVVTTRHAKTQQVGFASVDLASGRVAMLVEQEKHYGSDNRPAAVSRDGRTITYLAQDAQHPPDIWVTDAGFRTHRQLTHANPQFESYVLGASRVLDFQTKQGASLQGALLLPAGYEPGKRYPLIVKVYGGPHGLDEVYQFGFTWEAGWNAQTFATRGYAVLFPPAPYRVGTPMRDLADAILPAIDAAIALGVADPDRIGIQGHSYGGYATLALIAQSTRFKAAVAYAGLADLVSMYGSLMPGDDAGTRGGGIGWAETGQGSMGGSPWQFRDRYIENSPLFFLDRVETPLLLIHGDQDGGGARTRQSDEVFVALRRLGKEVEYRRYQDEEHVVGMNGEDNLRDLWTATVRWFDSHLEPEASAGRGAAAR